MGRELKRKQAKRDGRNVKEMQEVTQNNELKPKTFFIIMGFLLLFFVILYIITGLFITKDIKWFGKDNKEINEGSSIENKILAKDSLRQAEEDYYVYFYDTTKEDNEISNLLSSVSEKVYRVDLHDDFNSNFVGEPSGIVDNIESLRVSDPTVIKVSSEKIVNYYTGTAEIKLALGE